MRFARLSYVLGCAVLVAGLAACSSDSLPPPRKDGAPRDAAGDGKKPTPDLPKTDAKKTDAKQADAEAGDGPVVVPDIPERRDAPPPLCVGKADGTVCGAASKEICLKEQCVASSCGDGYVDTAGGEDCEDGNLISGDGCSNCRFDCKVAQDCDDGNTCNGSETCDTTKHLCQAGTPPGGTPACKKPDGSAGVCNAGTCVTAGCGNTVKEGTEECDDGNQIPGDGCENNCTLTCKIDKDCDDGDLCTGTETCDKTNPAKPVCKGGTAVSCQTTNCNGTCDPATGKCSYADVDKDGATCDKDCNDADPAIYPGAFECKDGKDNDCNPATADGKDGDCLCYRDNDKDGFAPTGAATLIAVTCPAGYTRTAPTSPSNSDCWDSRADVLPGQSSYFTSSYCKLYTKPPLSVCLVSSYDYNCDGSATQQYTALHSPCKLVTLFGKNYCLGSGWTGNTAPACGVSANYTTCSLFSFVKPYCSASTASRTQACH